MSIVELTTLITLQDHPATKEFNCVILIGMRGSGKSRNGEVLARYLQWDFADMDQLFEVTSLAFTVEIPSDNM